MSATCHASPIDRSFQLTVTDLRSVQRVLAMLTARSYTPTRFEAAQAQEGHWRLTIGCLADPNSAGLLLARLRRLPSVLNADASTAAQAAAR